MSKNIILFLSDITKQSRALCEEITYGIDVCELPVIVVYPNMKFVGYGDQLSARAVARWDNLPCLKSRIKDVPTAHVPLKKEHLERALTDPHFSVCTKTENCTVGFNTSHEFGIHELGKQIEARLESGR